MTSSVSYIQAKASAHLAPVADSHELIQTGFELVCVQDIVESECKVVTK